MHSALIISQIDYLAGKSSCFIIPDIAGSTDKVQNSNSKMQFSLLKSKKKKKFIRENNELRI